MTKDEIELIEVNKEIAIAGNLEWSIVIESMILNTYREALKQGQTLPIDSVSQQRELLKKWWEYFDEESVAVNCSEQEREEVITDFFNCGITLNIK
tara:strand:- start:53 stop:340 length:288 start_codon:yes stop_codon:yes gene_type:complete